MPFLLGSSGQKSEVGIGDLLCTGSVQYPVEKKEGRPLAATTGRQIETTSVALCFLLL